MKRVVCCMLCAVSCALGAGSDAPTDRLREIARHLADRHATRVVVDPALTPTSPPEAPDDMLPIDRALEMLTKSLHGSAWRRVYLPQHASAGPLPAQELATAARTLDALAADRLAVENCASRQVTLFLTEPFPSSQSSAGPEGPAGEQGQRKPLKRGTPAAQPTGSGDRSAHEGSAALERHAPIMPLEARRFSARPAYLLYSIAAEEDVRKPESRLADLQRQQLEIPLPEEQQALAMLLTMQLIHDLEPAKAEQLMRRTAEAGMRLWESTPPREREELIRQSFQVMQRFVSAPLAGSAGVSAGRPPPPAITRLGQAGGTPALPGFTAELKALAATLAARYDAPFLVDPALFLALLPPAPAADLPVEKAMEVVTAPLSGIAWRRVYLTDAPRDPIERTSAVEKLATDVRALERLEIGDLLLEDPAARRAITYLKNQPRSDSFERELARWKLNQKPVYLFYSTTPAARGGTLAERSASLQREQMALMLGMSAEQMEQSMEQVLQAFRSADTARRTRLLGLPVMAGMLAVWFPRAALEGQSPAP